jgi:branched-chain amino acid transport system ATP-binding protein
MTQPAVQAHTSGAPAPQTADAFLTVNNIEVVYSRVILVLKGVSLTVPRGGIVALLGANGAGKTTTLKAISNLLHAERGEVTKGSIHLDGQEVHRLSPNALVQRGCIQVMEGRRCFGHLTIAENLMTGAFTRRAGKAEIAADLEKVYAYFPRLRDRRESLAGYTSGGEQQMCAIGRALMSKPKLLLMDEPSAGLAPLVVQQVFELVQRIRAEGLTVLIVEQNVQQVLEVVDRAYLLEVGKIKLSGTAAELKNNSFIRQSYMGL